MMKVVEELTNKPGWWLKVHDPEITEKWKKEALEMDWPSYRRYADFTPAMAEAVRSCGINTFRLGTDKEYTVHQGTAGEG